ncbi:MAG: nucleotidyltransferase family protein, partial [Acidobacteriaceae bacterium]
MLWALRFHGAEFDALRTLDASGWSGLLSFCDLAHLTLRLSEFDQALLPHWVKRRIAKNVTDNALRSVRIGATYTELAEALNEACVEHLVLKGFAQYPGYVTAPRLRVQSDIDLFCRQESIGRAYNTLVGLGYEADRTLEHVPADHWPAMVRKGNWEWRGNIFDPEMPPGVELHYCLWNEANERFAIAGVEQFWDRRITREVGGLVFPGLDLADSLGYSALHVLRNLFRGDWILRQVYE